MTLEEWLERLKGVPGSHLAATAPTFTATTLDLTTPSSTASQLQQVAEHTDVYLCAASMRAGKRGAAEASHLHGLWLDLDTDDGLHRPPEGARLPTRSEAQDLIAGFPPPSLLIDTGGGYQVWWLFPQPMPAAEWAHAPRQLNDHIIALGKQQGIHVDQVGDLARILRPIGTYNHKWRRLKEETGEGDGQLRPVTVVTSSPLRYTPERILSYIPTPDTQLATPSTTGVTASGTPTLTAGHTDIERWEAATPWEDILCPYGWTLFRVLSCGAKEWTRPNPDPTTNKKSAVTDLNGIPVMVVHSAATNLPTGAGQRLTKFRVYTLLAHGGDATAASAAIRAAYGTPKATPIPTVTTLTQPTTTAVEAEGRRDVHPPGQPLKNANHYIWHTHQHNGTMTLAYTNGDFRAWGGKSWQVLHPDDLRAGMYAHFDGTTHLNKDGDPVPFHPTKTRVDGIIDATKAIARTPDQQTVPAWLTPPDHGHPASEMIPLANGLLHWPTRTLHPHTPHFWCHHHLPYNWNPDTGTPERWTTFLTEIFNGDTQSIQAIQEMFGYLLSGGLWLHKLFAIIGPKRAGKGTIARVLTALIGDTNIASPTLSSLTETFGLQTLIGKPVAVIPDARIRKADAAAVERLLSVTGEDRLTVARKYQPHWEGTLPTRLVLMSNEIPALHDAAGALASRIIFIMTQQSFYGKENHELTPQLLGELEQIFGWSLDGLDRLAARGRMIVPDSAAQIQEEMEELSSPIIAFLDDAITVDPEAECDSDELYRVWVRWCSHNGRDYTGNIQWFGRDLRAAMPNIQVARPRVNGRRTRQYQGIRITDDFTPKTPPELF